MLSKYMSGRNGTKSLVTESAAELKVSATVPHGKGLSVLVVNTSDAAQEFSIEIDGGKVRPTLHRHLYDPQHALDPETPADFHAPVRDTIPARGVAVYSTLRP
jgi:hypothetical protein